MITEVAKRSPADGIMKEGDVLLGVADQPFQYDPRTELGKALTIAEASDGNLSFFAVVTEKLKQSRFNLNYSEATAQQLSTIARRPKKF